MASCHKLRPGGAHGGTYAGRQGFSYFEGIARETVGAEAICMHLLTIPPGARAKAHRHDGHETAIYVLAGRAAMLWGEGLEHRMDVEAGDMVHIPAGVPHLPWNPGGEPAVAVIARTDPHEQESVVLLPHLDGRLPP